MNEHFVPRQGRPRGAPRPRRHLHGGHPGHEPGPGRLADDRVPDARPGAVLRRAPTSRPRTATAGPGFRTLLDADRRPLAARTAPALRAQAAELDALPARERAARARDRRRARTSCARRSPSSRATSTSAGAASAARPSSRPPPACRLLLRAHRRFGDADALAHGRARRSTRWPAAACTTSSAAASTATRSTSAGWCPHFEKMLYDNALLARVYLEGFQATGDAFYQRIAARDPRLRPARDDVARGRLLLRDRRRHRGRGGQVLRLDAGGDPGGACGDAEDARASSAPYYDITERGQLRRAQHPEHARGRSARWPRELGIAARRSWTRVARRARAPVCTRRARGACRPALDDKVLTAWNGLMIGALAEGHRVLGEPRYLDAAARAADFLLRPPARGGRTAAAHLARGHARTSPPTSRTTPTWPTALARPLRGGRRRRATCARRSALAERDPRRTSPPRTGGFFSTARDHEPLIVRHREGHDGATPAANARRRARPGPALLSPRPRGPARARRSRRSAPRARAIARQPRAFATSLVAVDLLLEGPVELALVGATSDPGREALRARGRRATTCPTASSRQHDPAARRRGPAAARGQGAGRAAAPRSTSAATSPASAR